MSAEIKYYINYDAKTVTAVIDNMIVNIDDKCYNLRPNRYSSLIPMSFYRTHMANRIHSTIKAEKTDVFDKKDIERFKYLAKCSVKKKYHECIIRNETNLINDLYRYANSLEKDIERNRTILNNKPFRYIERKEWLNMEHNKDKNDTKEI